MWDYFKVPYFLNHSGESTEFEKYYLFLNEHLCQSIFQIKNPLPLKSLETQSSAPFCLINVLSFCHILNTLHLGVIELNILLLEHFEGITIASYTTVERQKKSTVLVFLPHFDKKSKKKTFRLNCVCCISCFPTTARCDYIEGTAWSLWGGPSPWLTISFPSGWERWTRASRTCWLPGCSSKYGCLSMNVPRPILSSCWKLTDTSYLVPVFLQSLYSFKLLYQFLS